MWKGVVNMEKKLQKPYLTNYNLFMAQDLWQAPLSNVVEKSC